MIQKKMIPDSLCKNISEPTATEEDIVLNKKVSFGHGFLYAPHPVRKGVSQHLLLSITSTHRTFSPINNHRYLRNTSDISGSSLSQFQEWIIRILGNGLQAVEMDFKEDVSKE